MTELDLGSHSSARATLSKFGLQSVPKYSETGRLMEGASLNAPAVCLVVMFVLVYVSDRGFSFAHDQQS